MLEIDCKFVLEWANNYDVQFGDSYDKREEEAVRGWLSSIPESKYLDKKMFVRLCEWKSARPRKHCRANDEATIIEVTRAAYIASDSLVKLSLLKTLQGVGVAVAACILHFLQPDVYPIFDYHARNTLKKAGLWTREDSRSSDDRAWLEYVRVMRELSKKLGVTLRQLDKALFAYDKYPKYRGVQEGRKPLFL